MLRTYAEPGHVDRIATRNDLSYWTELTAEEKREILFDATKDVIGMHNQTDPEQPDRPWLMGDPSLRTACVFQALRRAKHPDFIHLAENISVLTEDRYRDQVVEVESVKGNVSDPVAQKIVAEFLEAMNVHTGTTFC